MKNTLISEPKTMKDYSRIYRILHWTIALSILLLLFTIFLRLTWMNKHNVSDIIEKNLSAQGISITHDQSIGLAKQIRNPMWQWHIYLGYVLTGLLSIRFLLPIFGIMKFQNPFAKDLTIKVRMQKLSYVIFYIGIAISLITGLVMLYGPKSMGEQAENTHVLALYYLIPFIVIHLAGVLIAEFTDQKGIISRIIRGTDKN